MSRLFDLAAIVIAAAGALVGLALFTWANGQAVVGFSREAQFGMVGFAVIWSLAVLWLLRRFNVRKAHDA